jgi:hypothetical protein
MTAEILAATEHLVLRRMTNDAPAALAAYRSDPVQAATSHGRRLPGRGPGLAAGMTGGTGRAVMAASRTGGGCSAGGRDGRGDRPPGACSSGACLGKSHPNLCPRGESPGTYCRPSRVSWSSGGSGDRAGGPLDQADDDRDVWHCWR